MSAPSRRPSGGSSGLAALINQSSIRPSASAPPIPSKLPSVEEEEPSIPPPPVPQANSESSSTSNGGMTPITSVFERIEEKASIVTPNNVKPSELKIAVPPIVPGSNKCPVCEKSVYKVEEVIAAGRTWHKGCFRCGTFSKDGCNKVLTRDKYLDHDKEPYCNACYDKLWKPKGYGYSGAMNTNNYGRSSDLTASEIEAVQNMSISESSSSSSFGSSSVATRRPSASESLAHAINNSSNEVSTKSTPAASIPKPANAAPVFAKRPSMADARAIHAELGTASIVPTSDTSLQTNKCPVCEKSVYKVEEVIAAGRTWHKGCFRCGTFSKDGCNKVLTRDKYLDHDKEPYCNACYDKLWKPKGYGYSGAFSATVTEDTSSATITEKQVEKPIVERRSSYVGNTFAGVGSVGAAVQASAPAEKPSFVNKTADKIKAATTAAPTCSICTKTVYKMEEVVALGRTYHKTCFTCGGRAGDGCSRTLKLDGYLEHSNQPYCNSCYGKLWKPKGFGTGASLTTDYGKSGADEVNAAKAVLSSSSSAPSYAPPPVPAPSIATQSTFVFEQTTPVLDTSHIPARRPSSSSTPILVLAPKKSQEANPLGFSDAELAVLKQSEERKSGLKQGQKPHEYAGNNDEVDEGEW